MWPPTPSLVSEFFLFSLPSLPPPSPPSLPHLLSQSSPSPHPPPHRSSKPYRALSRRIGRGNGPKMNHCPSFEDDDAPSLDLFFSFLIIDDLRSMLVLCIWLFFSSSKIPFFFCQQLLLVGMLWRERKFNFLKNYCRSQEFLQKRTKLHQ